jgi:hypothetical protein
MILVGLVILLGSIAWIVLVIMAAASHPTGKVPGGTGMFVIGLGGAVIGLALIAAGAVMWGMLLFGATA